MIHLASAVVIPKLVTWSMRAVNETVKFLKLTQKKASDKKRSSSEINKLDRELKAAERKYYQDKTKHDRDSLEIEKQKLANDNTRIGIEVRFVVS